MLRESVDLARVGVERDELTFDATQQDADQVVLDFAMAGIAVRTLAICVRS